MSTASLFEGRIQDRGLYEYNNAETAGEDLLPGNLVALGAAGTVAKAGANAQAPGFAFQIVVTDLFQGTFGNDNTGDDQWDVPYESGNEVQTMIPKAGSRFWCRTTADEISVGDSVQIEVSTGRVQPYGGGSVDGYIVGVARTANFDNEQSDAATADDLVLVEFS